MTPSMTARYCGLKPCEILLALKQLKEIVTSGDVSSLGDRDFGVCYNLDHILWSQDCNGDSYSFVETNAHGWPQHRTGEAGEVFPVPHVKGYGNWEGPNLEARISLIDWLINICVADIETLEGISNEHGN